MTKEELLKNISTYCSYEHNNDFQLLKDSLYELVKEKMCESEVFSSFWQKNNGFCYYAVTSKRFLKFLLTLDSDADCSKFRCDFYSLRSLQHYEEEGSIYRNQDYVNEVRTSTVKLFFDAREEKIETKGDIEELRTFIKGLDKAIACL